MSWWLNGRSAEDAPPDADLTDCRIQYAASGTAAGIRVSTVRAASSIKNQPDPTRASHSPFKPLGS